LLELLGLAHVVFLINLKGPFIHGGWPLFSLTLLVEVEGSLLKRWAALYALSRVWRREEKEKHMRALARLTSSSMVW
jgi:hypothetical protein